MPTTRPLQLTHLRPDASAKPASTAMVPVAIPAQWVSPTPRLPSPDPTFVTQLIANAEQRAERRRWPRDRAADASLAYAHPHHAYVAGLKTRRMI